MKNTLINVFIFAAGAAIGSAVTWQFVRKKYERIAEEEINSYREARDHADEVIAEEACDEPCEEVPDDSVATFPTEEEKNEYRDIIKNYREGESDSMEIGTPPYVISYEEYGDIDEYESMCLTYYEDGVVTDDWGDVIEDIPNTVGKDFASHYGENVDDPDIVYVRNDRLKTDYEICRDGRKFSELDNGESNNE